MFHASRQLGELVNSDTIKVIYDNIADKKSRISTNAIGFIYI